MTLDHPPGEGEETGHVARARPSMPETAKRKQELSRRLSGNGGCRSGSDRGEHALDARPDGFHIAVSERGSDEPHDLTIERIAVAMRELERIGGEVAGVIPEPETLQAIAKGKELPRRR
jgi:hypothetical protein